MRNFYLKNHNELIARLTTNNVKVSEFHNALINWTMSMIGKKDGSQFKNSFLYLDDHGHNINASWTVKTDNYFIKHTGKEITIEKVGVAYSIEEVTNCVPFDWDKFETENK